MDEAWNGGRGVGESSMLSMETDSGRDLNDSDEASGGGWLEVRTSKISSMSILGHVICWVRVRLPPLTSSRTPGRQARTTSAPRSVVIACQHYNHGHDDAHPRPPRGHRVRYLPVSPLTRSGASCSGKTLLAKHLQRLLPTSLLVHQDDFAPTAETVPVHAVHGVEDWDDPDTCIEWTRWRALLAHIRACGALPEGHASWDHLNAQTEVDVPAQVVAGCARALDEEIGAAGERGERVLVVLVDGFVLYYDALARGLLDVQILLRVPRETLRERREGRAVYALQSELDRVGWVGRFVWDQVSLGTGEGGRGWMLTAALTGEITDPCRVVCGRRCGDE